MPRFPFLGLSLTTENTTSQSQKPVRDSGNGKQLNSVSLYPLLQFRGKQGASHNTQLAPSGFLLLFCSVSQKLNLQLRHNQHPEALCIISRALALQAHCGACFGNTFLPFSLTQNKYVWCLTQAGPGGANVMMWCCCWGQEMSCELGKCVFQLRLPSFTWHQFMFCFRWLLLFHVTTVSVIQNLVMDVCLFVFILSSFGLRNEAAAGCHLSLSAPLSWWCAGGSFKQELSRPTLPPGG